MKKFFIAIAAILIIISIYLLYPRSGSFNNLVLNKYPLEKPFKIYIYKNLTEKTITDTDKLNGILSYLDSYQFIEYKRQIPYEENDRYTLAIYDNKYKVLAITIRNKNYIEVHVSNSRERGQKYYKIIDNSLDMKYIENFYNQFKESDIK